MLAGVLGAGCSDAPVIDMPVMNMPAQQQSVQPTVSSMHGLRNGEAFELRDRHQSTVLLQHVQLCEVVSV